MIRSMQATGIVQGTLAEEGEGGKEETTGCYFYRYRSKEETSTSTSTAQGRNSSIS